MDMVFWNCGVRAPLVPIKTGAGAGRKLINLLRAPQSFTAPSGKARISPSHSFFTQTHSSHNHTSSVTMSSNGQNGTKEAVKPKYDPDFTRNVINAAGPKTSPRLRTVMASLIQHLHDFARENDITIPEWMEAVKMINWAGQMSNDRRNEGQLLCDVIGLESYGSP